MPLRVSGKNIKVGEALRGRINARLAGAMAKYFDGGFSGHVTIGQEGFGFRTECVVHLDSGIVLEADALAADAYASADQAALRIEKRLRRYKRWRKDRQAVRADGKRSISIRSIAVQSTCRPLWFPAERPARIPRRTIRLSLPNRRQS